MEAILREMGVSHHWSQGIPRQPWHCDLLPHLFSPAEWERIVAGLRQRLTAFEYLLRDLHGRREILRSGVLPVHAVLGSAHYLNASVGLPLPHGSYLHLCGVRLRRNAHGDFSVQHHQFGRPSGISYMMQNRRALARVLPEFFQDTAVRSLAETPLALIEAWRAAAREVADPSVVLLSPGIDSPFYSDHSFLARRMGIPVVQGGDLLVLDTRVYLKTVRGLRRVDVIYNQIPEVWLDPLVFKKGSHLGVPGLVHCVRAGTVKVINAIGSQLADDRVLLCFAPKIIRFYLGEEALLPSTPTLWLGDIDQCEMVLDRIDDYHIQPVDADDSSDMSHSSAENLAQRVRKDASRYVAQLKGQQGVTRRYEAGKAAELEVDHLVFAMRQEHSFEVFPGALTRIFKEARWDTKDSWVQGSDVDSPAVSPAPRRISEMSVPSRNVTSRVAESFYWMGRYLERAYHQAYLIQVVETLESEELNSAERKLYRPMWNRLLPPLEKSTGESRRSITTRLDRYRLVLAREPGSVVSTFGRAMANAESVQESLSPESWAALSDLSVLFQKTKFRSNLADEECARIARRLSETVTQRIPQFFAVAARTVLGDDGWRFCEVGEMLERAVITANSVLSISKSLTRQPNPTEIELSAFLRLLGTRDAYRRIYQVRAEPVALLEILWQHPEAPRSVCRCLKACVELLQESCVNDTGGAADALRGIEALIHRIRRVDWSQFLNRVPEEDMARADSIAAGAESHRLGPLLNELLDAVLNMHHLISDGFLSHQAYIVDAVQPFLTGLGHGI